jgi:O-antigen ligase
VLVVVTLGLLPELRNALWLRFETIMLPYGTFSRRLVLWDTALTAFLNHPWLGVGPGSFRTIYEVLPTLHLQPLHIYVRGLSAHNLFLHYLAEAGVVGAFALVALFVNQFRVIRSVWIRNLTGAQIGATLSLYLVGLLLLATTFLEAGWMWGSSGYIFAFFVALIVRYRQQLAVVTSSRSSFGRLRSDRS